MLTIISSFFATRIPFLFVICRYFSPLSTSCCTTKLAFMRNLAPSLMVKGFDFSASTEPGAVKSMVMSGRPSTSRASALMTQRRSSLGSTKMGGDDEMPREAFQRLRDSSFWSGSWSMLGQMFQRLIAMKLRKDRGTLAREERGSMSARGLPDGCSKQILDIIITQLASLQGDEIVQEDVEVLYRLDSPQGRHCGATVLSADTRADEGQSFENLASCTDRALHILQPSFSLRP